MKNLKQFEKGKVMSNAIEKKVIEISFLSKCPKRLLLIKLLDVINNLKNTKEIYSQTDIFNILNFLLRKDNFKEIKDLRSLRYLIRILTDEIRIMTKKTTANLQVRSDSQFGSNVSYIFLFSLKEMQRKINDFINEKHLKKVQRCSERTKQAEKNVSRIVTIYNKDIIKINKNSFESQIHERFILKKQREHKESAVIQNLLKMKEIEETKLRFLILNYEKILKVLSEYEIREIDSYFSSEFFNSRNLSSPHFLDATKAYSNIRKNKMLENFRATHKTRDKKEKEKQERSEMKDKMRRQIDLQRTHANCLECKKLTVKTELRESLCPACQERQEKYKILFKKFAIEFLKENGIKANENEFEKLNLFKILQARGLDIEFAEKRETFFKGGI